MNNNSINSNTTEWYQQRMNQIDRQLQEEAGSAQLPPEPPATEEEIMTSQENLDWISPNNPFREEHTQNVRNMENWLRGGWRRAAPLNRGSLYADLAEAMDRSRIRARSWEDDPREIDPSAPLETGPLPYYRMPDTLAPAGYEWRRLVGQMVAPRWQYDGPIVELERISGDPDPVIAVLQPIIIPQMADPPDPPEGFHWITTTRPYPPRARGHMDQRTIEIVGPQAPINPEIRQFAVLEFIPEEGVEQREVFPDPPEGYYWMVLPPGLPPPGWGAIEIVARAEHHWPRHNRVFGILQAGQPPVPVFEQQPAENSQTQEEQDWPLPPGAPQNYLPKTDEDLQIEQRNMRNPDGSQMTAEEKLQRKRDEELCAACMTNVKDCVFVPCGHRGLCMKCAGHPRVINCPTCRTEFKGYSS